MNANVTGVLAKILEPIGYSNLISPKAERSTVLSNWALDNGRFIVFKKALKGIKIEWNEEEWIDMLLWSMHLEPLRKVAYPATKPQWGIVPDVVGDSKATIEEFHRYKDIFKAIGLPMAYAVQNGAVPKDVPKEASVIFVGGTRDWKWETAEMWCKEFPRVHIGGVNSLQGFILAEKYGAESVDGSAMTKNHKQKMDLVSFLTKEYLNEGLFGEHPDFKKEIYREAIAHIYRKDKKQYTKRKKKLVKESCKGILY